MGASYRSGRHRTLQALAECVSTSHPKIELASRNSTWTTALEPCLSVDPREVVLRAPQALKPSSPQALKHQAAAMVLAHSHPSAIVRPSRADQALIQTLKAALWNTR